MGIENLRHKLVHPARPRDSLAIRTPWVRREIAAPYIFSLSRALSAACETSSRRASRRESERRMTAHKRRGNAPLSQTARIAKADRWNSPRWFAAASRHKRGETAAAPSALRFGGKKRQKGIRGADAACAAVGIADSPMPTACVLRTDNPRASSEARCWNAAKRAREGLMNLDKSHRFFSPHL